MSSDSYVKEAIKNVKKRLKENGLEYNKNLSDIKYLAKNPFESVEYRPKLDTSMECNEYQVSFYHKIIKVVRWFIEIGRIDN